MSFHLRKTPRGEFWWPRYGWWINTPSPSMTTRTYPGKQTFLWKDGHFGCSFAVSGPRPNDSCLKVWFRSNQVAWAREEEQCARSNWKVFCVAFQAEVPGTSVGCFAFLLAPPTDLVFDFRVGSWRTVRSNGNVLCYCWLVADVWRVGYFLVLFQNSSAWLSLKWKTCRRFVAFFSFIKCIYTWRGRGKEREVRALWTEGWPSSVTCRSRQLNGSKTKLWEQKPMEENRISWRALLLLGVVASPGRVLGWAHHWAVTTELAMNACRALFSVHWWSFSMEPESWAPNRALGCPFPSAASALVRCPFVLSGIFLFHKC